MVRTSRRAFLGGMAGSAMAVGWPARAQNPSSITVTSFGGVWETSIREVVVPEFEKRTNIKANVLLGGPPQWMAQIEANRAKPPIDILVNVPDLALVAGRSGLVEKVSAQRAPNLADVPRSFIDIVDGYGSVFTYGCWGLCYHERVKNPPKSLAEFIDGTVKGKWRAALPSMLGFAETAHVLIWSFSDILGGSIDNVDPAFATIQKMKPNSVFWNGISDPLTLLESGEADVSIYVDGRTWAAFELWREMDTLHQPRRAGREPAQRGPEGRQRSRRRLGLFRLHALADRSIPSSRASQLRGQQPEGPVSSETEGTDHKMGADALAALREIDGRDKATMG